MISADIVAAACELLQIRCVLHYVHLYRSRTERGPEEPCGCHLGVKLCLHYRAEWGDASPHYNRVYANQKVAELTRMKSEADKALDSVYYPLILQLVRKREHNGVMGTRFGKVLDLTQQGDLARALGGSYIPHLVYDAIQSTRIEAVDPAPEYPPDSYTKRVQEMRVQQGQVDQGIPPEVTEMYQKIPIGQEMELIAIKER